MTILALLLPFFHHGVPSWPSNFVIHVIFVLGGLELIRLAETRPQSRVLQTLRTFYPVIFILCGWNELNEMILMFHGPFWVTDLLILADEKLFGLHPTVWKQQFYSPWLDEIMSFLYACYYLMIPLATLPLFIRGKQRKTMAVFSIGAMAYFINFALLYAFPSLCARDFVAGRTPCCRLFWLSLPIFDSLFTARRICFGRMLSVIARFGEFCLGFCSMAI